jgi:cell division protein FtsQ
VAVSVLAVVAVIGGCVAVYRSPLFAVRRIEVVGNVRLSSQAVRGLARVPTDSTLIRFPADAVAERVAKDPWVASVTVSRLFPDGMRIRIVERQPVAMVDAGATLWLVDSTGMVMAQRSSEQTASVVVVRDVPGLDPKPGRRTTSEALMNAIGVLEGISDRLRAMIGSISAPSIDGTTLYTREKVEIVFGDAAEARVKDALVLRILDEHRGKVVSIDVRTVDRPTWRGLPK